MLFSLIAARYLADLIVLCIVALAQAGAGWSILRKPAVRTSRAFQVAIVTAWVASVVFMMIGLILRSGQVSRHFSVGVAGWVRGAAMVWAFFSALTVVAYGLASLIARPQAGHSPGRRRFLGAVRWALLGAPPLAAGYGTFIGRFRMSLREQDIPIPGLPRDLEGLRLAQLTDIHLSPFLSVNQLERAVDMANETHPHLTLVTGDLITSGRDPLDDCLRALSRLKADAGVFGCMGNHEIYAVTEEYTQREGARLGMHFLRQQSALLRFGSAGLNLAGVDYQHFKKPYLVGAEELRVPGALNVLLSHNPDVFPVAAAKGFPFTVSGHTHGGQVRVEILHQDLNVARFFTPFVDGLYTGKDGSSIFVSRGIGTIGLPARVGAPPEVALLRLCRT